MLTAPGPSTPPTSSPGTPTARSALPSPLKSPRTAPSADAAPPGQKDTNPSAINQARKRRRVIESLQIAPAPTGAGVKAVAPVVRYGATLSPGAALRAVRTRLHDPSLAVLVAL